MKNYSWQNELVSHMEKIDRQIKSMSDTCVLAAKNICCEDMDAFYENLSRLQSLAVSIIKAVQKELSFGPPDNEKKILESWADMGSIQKKDEGQCLCLELPPLYGKKTTHLDVVRSVARAIAVQYAFFGGEKVVYDDCVVIFRHQYKKGAFMHDKLDHDNVLISSALNILADFFLADDDPEVCDIFQCYSYADYPATQIIIVPRDRFATWLAENGYSKGGTNLC